ncbi:MAG: hypothetical protein AMJ58_12580 [Gammaproteobacteria bacterium SG8_30]|nr:MAG: hypothetical protein AMJ58_12580 [Gammaproteobacteria bacterium SG8_30]
MMPPPQAAAGSSTPPLASTPSSPNACRISALQQRRTAPHSDATTCSLFWCMRSVTSWGMGTSPGWG